MSISDQIADQCETLDQARGVIRALLLSDTRAPGFSLEHDHVGISLRDWIAVMAMRGILEDTFLDLSKESHTRAIAIKSYLMADAMLTERTTAREVT
jgi:hypothetical protein